MRPFSDSSCNARPAGEPDDYCRWCGAALPIDRYWGKRMFCSARCGRAEYNHLEREARAETRVGRRCAVCDGPISPHKRPDTIYCGKRCMDAAFRARRDGPKQERPCIQCGEPIGRNRRRDVMFCDKRCKDAAYYRRNTRRKKAKHLEASRRYKARKRA